MILAGDIGGTKTNLALFSETDKTYGLSHLQSFHSKDYAGLAPILEEYLKSINTPIEKAAFAIAGPVKNGVCKTTNLPWIVDAKELSTRFHLPVFLLNDLEANAYAIDILEKKDLLILYEGEKLAANRAVISPGTGLGEAGLYWNGKKHFPFACEGGHCDFGPRGEVQIELCRYLFKTFGHVSAERIVSGPGLHNVYLFFRDILKRPEPAWLKEKMQMDDPAKVITECALNNSSELCNEALDLFVSVFGAEASNCALKFMALGGVYLGGGIPPKILPKLQDSTFYQGFIDKGRMNQLLQSVTISVVLDDKASLKGAARYAKWVAEEALSV